jgi:hypothetical protein
MKTLIYTLIFIALLAAGCSEENNPVNNSNPPTADTLFFAALHEINPGDSVRSKFLYSNSFGNISSIKISFTGETNDTVYAPYAGQADVWIDNTNPVSRIYQENLSGPTINGYKEFTVNVNSSPNWLATFHLSSTINKFVRLRNIAVIRN